VLAEIELINAQMALSQGNFADARMRSQQSLGTSSTQYEEIPIEAKYTLGLASTFLGARAEGERWCREAVDAAAKVGDVALLLRAQLALAEVQLANGNARGALETATQAQARLALTGQQESEWRACATAARASRALHDDAGAQKQMKQAETLLAQLKQSWGADTFSRYLARRDIQTLQQQSGVTIATATTTSTTH